MTRETSEAVRGEVREWLEAHWDPSLSLRAWRELLAHSGWGCPSWPSEWFGRGLPVAMDRVVAEEFRRVGAVGVAAGGGVGLAAPTLLEHGSDDLKRRLLRPIVTGEHIWCQLFSEPGSGSDLAGLTTRADRDGDEFVVTGQKVWTTSAQHADYGMLLARTDWDVPKHQGITYFAFDMKQPGVTVRPLEQMNGHASFNEVFIDGARVSAADVIGEIDQGWRVALATLAHERRLSTLQGPGAVEGEGRALDEYREERAHAMAPYVWYPQRFGRVDLVLKRAQETGRIADPVVRQEIAKLLSLSRAATWTAERAKQARRRGLPPGPEGSIGKLCGSHIARAAADVHALIAGAEALLNGPNTAEGGLIAEVLVSTPAQSIAGGTDEIQRNILAERALGLPREPSVDRDKPFRDVPRNRRG